VAKFFIPGFIDCHAHAPQYPQAGTGTDLQLLEWLKTYTMPLENRFKDTTSEKGRAFVTEAYTAAVKRFLRNGTTTCCWYGTIHVPANKILVDIVQKYGQRGFVGKVCMNANSMDYMTEHKGEENAEQLVIKDNEDFINYIEEIKSPLITPIITPRFAPSCTLKLLTELGSLAKSKSLPIQTHLSENVAEVQWVKSLFGKGYVDVYDSTGLLTEKTVLAHCIHLTEEEIDLMKERNVGIAHCPVSNYTLSSGEMRTRHLLKKKN